MLKLITIFTASNLNIFVMRYFINENLEPCTPCIEFSEIAFKLFQRYVRTRKSRTWVVLTNCIFTDVPDNSLVLTQIQVSKKPSL